MWCFTALHFVLASCRQEMNPRARSHSRYAEPSESLIEADQAVPIRSTAQPWGSQLCTAELPPIPLTPEALLYSKRKMLILQLFVLINLSFHQVSKETHFLVCLPHGLLAHAVQQGRATLSRCLPAICSSSVPHEASDWIFKRNKGFESN